MIETGTVTSFNAATSAVPVRFGLLVNTPRLAAWPATTHVAAPAELHVRHVEPAPVCVYVIFDT